MASGLGLLALAKVIVLTNTVALVITLAILGTIVLLGGAPGLGRGTQDERRQIDRSITGGPL